MGHHFLSQNQLDCIVLVALMNTSLWYTYLLGPPLELNHITIEANDVSISTHCRLTSYLGNETLFVGASPEVSE